MGDSKFDTVYTRLAPEPWQAMPVGAGDLSAMVAFGGALELHLSKTDWWGWSESDDPHYKYNLLSPGHLSLEFSPSVEPGAVVEFEQRLAVLDGEVRLTCKTKTGRIDLRVWGDVGHQALVVEVSDQREDRGSARLVLREWRKTVEIGQSPGRLWAVEVNRRPLGPTLANTGMERFFGTASDPYADRAGAVMAMVDGARSRTGPLSADRAELLVEGADSAEFRVVVAAWVGKGGAPLDAPQRALAELSQIPVDGLRHDHERWWQRFWSRSEIDLASVDGQADRLSRLWHVTLYSLACTGTGPCPPKFNGGPGLMEKDARSWGLAYWWQNTREHLWPLYAANQLDLAARLLEFYFAMLPYLKEQTRHVFAFDGAYLPETCLPWGHDEHRDLRDGYRNGYVGCIFSSGLELAQQLLTYVRFSGDENFLMERAYPWIAEVCRFYVNYATRKELPYRRYEYHIEPTNANETWWEVRDAQSDLAGLRVVLPELLALAARFGGQKELERQCRDLLDHLPPLPTGAVKKRSDSEEWDLDTAEELYAPFGAFLKDRRMHNSENPECYAIYPWSLAGIGSSRRDQATRTFQRRLHANAAAWSPCAIQAARLGMADEALRLIVEHADRFQRFPYGGWVSVGATPYPDGMSDVPYLDGAGVSATALEEMLLQSCPLPMEPGGRTGCGRILVCPATPTGWTGRYRLRAEGGFLFTVELNQGRPRRIRIESERGRICELANPWPEGAQVSSEKMVFGRVAGPSIRLAASPGEVYEIQPAASAE